MHTNIPGRPPIDLPASYESFAWYYPNCELQTKDWFVRHAGPDWTYLDCGANIGYFSILFAQLSPQGRVHAIEPTATADMLETNLRHHGCANVTVHRLAMGSHPGRREEKIFRLWGQPPDVMEYDFATVDSFVADQQLSRVDCLKIDVDSFDFEVLQGAEQTLARFDPWLVVELNHALSQRGQSNIAALDWLLARGYRHSLVLDHDNFIMRRSAPPEALASSRSLMLDFPALT
ncbi:MAG: FkbM family methyltransferase [Lacunisphaera sp.]|nr:FkbM family methyltransferase [Lacunisphaera sp.]